MKYETVEIPVWGGTIEIQVPVDEELEQRYRKSLPCLSFRALTCCLSEIKSLANELCSYRWGTAGLASLAAIVIIHL